MALFLFRGTLDNMAKTYAEIQEQIAKLQEQAAAIRQREVKDVIDRIKEAINVYGLTAADLGLGIGVARKSAARKKPGSDEVKYRDGNGNSWGGRGPRPRWLRDALAGGKSLDDFAV